MNTAFVCLLFSTEVWNGQQDKVCYTSSPATEVAYIVMIILHQSAAVKTK